MTEAPIARLETGVHNLDEILHGGWPQGSVTIVAGPPGSGKTILAQQIAFHNASPKSRVLYFTTLSEPTAKTLRYITQFSYFDAKKMETGVQFVDLGAVLRTQGLEQAQTVLMEHIKRVKPAIVVIDSFKVFDDLAKSKEELRKFGYEVAVQLMAWETTAFLLGEYGSNEIATNPLFSITDGLITLTQRESGGEQQRMLQIHKMRGTPHSCDEHSFVITSNGIEVYAPNVTIQRVPIQEQEKLESARCKTGISRLDDLLGEGIPRGSSLLIAGVAGTGKTVLLLEFIYRGALAGEKGIVFSFEETEERLRGAARGMGWDFDREIERGMIEIVFIPQPNILVERHLLMMQERISAMDARRVAVDSLSVFLHKVKDPQITREKTFQLASVIQNVGAVGFLATDVPYGANQISRLGVEETVVDGVVLLTSKEEGLNRERYVEVYKLRNTAHLKGRHNMVIGKGGIAVFPRYSEEAISELPPSLEISARLPSGVPGLDQLIGGGLLKRSMTLISGSPGIGKSILGIQFLIEGTKHGEPGVYVTLEEGPDQIFKTAEALGLPLAKAVEHGLAEIMFLSRDVVRAGQLLTVLTDKIGENHARRLVLDSASHLMVDHPSETDFKEVLYKLAMRFKHLGVTTIFNLESKLLFSREIVTDYDFSPIADNLMMLRYVSVGGQLEPSLTVIKTRGSAHDRGTHIFTIDKGGMRIKPTKKRVEDKE